MANDPKPPLTGYALWLLPAEEDAAKLQQLIEDLTTTTGGRRFDAHATLIGLEGYPADQEERITRIANTLADLASPIKAEITGLGMRDKYFQAAFLHMVPTAVLVQLNRAARYITPSDNDGSRWPPFMPHVSLTYGDYNTETKSTVTEWVNARIKFPMFVTLDRLTLVQVDGFPNEWVIKKTFPLTGKNTSTPQEK